MQEPVMEALEITGSVTSFHLIHPVTSANNPFPSTTLYLPNESTLLLKTISKLLIKSFLGPFIVAFIVSIFVFEMQFVWLYLDELMGKGLDFLIILKLLFYFSARLVSMALPMAILMASVMTMGNLAENYELASMKSAGISLLRIMRPLIFFIFFISVGAFFFANNVWPIANLKFRTILYSITKQKPALNLEERQFYDGIDGISIRVNSKNEETGELGDILIYDHRNRRGNKAVIRAKRGEMAQTDDQRYLVLTLYDGHSYDEQKETKKRQSDRVYPHISNHFEQQILRIDLSSLMFQKADEELFSKAYEMMTINQLDYAIDSIDTRIAKTEVDIGTYLNKHKPTRVDSVAISQNSDPRALLSTLSKAQTARVLDVAKNITRQQKEYVEGSMADVFLKNKFKRRHLIEWHRKFFFPVASLLLFFIGAPLGAIIRKGGVAMPALTAFVLFITFYIINVIGEKMAKIGTVDVWLGMWLSTFVLFPVGIFLTWKAMNDSSILNKEFYLKAFQAISNRLTGKKNAPA